MAPPPFRPIHAVLLALLAGVVAVVLVPGRSVRPEPADVLLALRSARGPVLPPPARAGATSATPVARYDKGTLSEVINGAAEAYLARGFTAAAFSTYTFGEASPGAIEVAAEAHRFQTEAGARDQALAERPPRANPVPGLASASSDGSVLVAVAGRELLKLTLLTSGASGVEALAAVAGAWMKEQR
jgi:hypothetical protein